MELDAQHILIAPPKHGKSTVARALVKEHLERYPNGIALVHDLNRQFGDLCARYESVAAFRATWSSAAAENKPVPRGAAFGCEWSHIAELAYELGSLWNRDIDVQVPIILVGDETTHMDTSGSTFIGKLDGKISANRRHLGTHLVLNLQRPAGVTEAFYTMSTDVLVFSQPGSRKTRTLEEYLGLADGRLDGIIGKPKFFYVHWKQGEGLV